MSFPTCPLAKVVTVELEGLDTGLRLDDVKAVFQAHKSFANTSAVAKRIKNALDLLNVAFKGSGSLLRTRTIVQSLVTLTCKIVATGRAAGVESKLRDFFKTFMAELALQVDKGQEATDADYVNFQKSVSERKGRRTNSSGNSAAEDVYRSARTRGDF
jgi:hypothetical protein